MQNLYKLFMDVDATQVEINPFGLTDTGRGMWRVMGCLSESDVQSFRLMPKSTLMIMLSFVRKVFLPNVIQRKRIHVKSKLADSI
jgi:hypothetical protein